MAAAATSPVELAEVLCMYVCMYVCMWQPVRLRFPFKFYGHTVRLVAVAASGLKVYYRHHYHHYCKPV